MHFLLGGIGGIASQVPEVLYAGDVDVAGGNLYPVFVGEYKCVVVSLCRVGSDDSHLQVGDVGDGNGNIFGDMVGIGRSIYFTFPLMRGPFPILQCSCPRCFLRIQRKCEGKCRCRKGAALPKEASSINSYT